MDQPKSEVVRKVTRFKPVSVVLKTIIYIIQSASLDDLRQRIMNKCRNITLEILQNARNSFETFKTLVNVKSLQEKWYTSFK